MPPPLVGEGRVRVESGRCRSHQAARTTAHIVERHRDARRRSSGPARGPCRPPPARRPDRSSSSAAAIAGCAVADLARARAAGQDRGADRGRVLAARIVVGDDRHVGQPRRGRAHQRALAAVAVAAGAEHHVQPAGGVRAQRGQQPLQRVRRVGVIDIDRGAVRPAARPAPCGRARRSARAGGRARRRCPAPSARAGRQQGVVGLEAAGQRQHRSRGGRRRPRPSAPGRPGAASTPQQADRVARLADRAQVQPPPAPPRRAAPPASPHPCRRRPARARPRAAGRRTGAAWRRGRRPGCRDSPGGRASGW